MAELKGDDLRTEQIIQEFAVGVGETVREALLILDADLRVRVANRAFFETFKVSPNEVENRLIYDLGNGQWNIPGLRELLEEILSENHSITDFEVEHAFPSIGRHVMQINARRLGAANTQLIEDITERKEKLQQEQSETLGQTDRLKDEFLSVISHELRTPLNAVLGFGSLLEDGAAGPLSVKQGHFVSMILKGGERMLALIDDLLDFASMQAGKFDVSPDETDFPALVEETSACFEPTAEENKIRIDSSINVPVPVYLDRRRIQQVLANLLSNAIKFTPKGGKIRVRAFLEEGQLVTEVSDDGLGISSEDLPKLFTPFKQLDMGLTRTAGGVGLGLSISKAIVDSHGGTIEADSEFGWGSTFTFRIPLEPLPS